MSVLELERPARVRVIGFDAFRGLAMLAMLVDHLAVVGGGPLELRLTIGRLAMPAFFLLAGHLSRRLTWRHFGVAWLGFLLPVVVPWIDAPNVLVWWALGCVLLWGLRVLELPVWLVPVVGLAVAANGWTWTSNTYDPWALWGLMAVGAMVPASGFTWAARAPRWVAVLGSWPITFYVGHLLILRALQLAL